MRSNDKSWLQLKLAETTKESIWNLGNASYAALFMKKLKAYRKMELPLAQLGPISRMTGSALIVASPNLTSRWSRSANHHPFLIINIPKTFIRIPVLTQNTSDFSSATVIIGSGLAGYTLIRELRKLDKTIPITLITREPGYFYSKPMLSTAFANKKGAAQLIVRQACFGSWCRSNSYSNSGQCCKWSDDCEWPRGIWPVSRSDSR